MTRVSIMLAFALVTLLKVYNNQENFPRTCGQISPLLDSL